MFWKILFVQLLITISIWGGCIQGNCSNGKGTFSWTEGSKKGNKYIGEFRNSKRHGKGTYYWNDGNKYVGEWKNDQREGIGVSYASNGGKVVGEWKNGNRISVLTNVKTQIREQQIRINQQEQANARFYREQDDRRYREQKAQANAKRDRRDSCLAQCEGFSNYTKGIFDTSSRERCKNACPSSW